MRRLLLAIVALLGCNRPQPKQEVSTWPYKVPAKLKDGTPVEICIYPKPIADDGFVINVYQPTDPPGRCWGTVIYPTPVK